MPNKLEYNVEDYDVYIGPASDERLGVLYEVIDLPGCIAFGKTYAEAVENGKRTFDEWIETAKELEWDIPEPGAGRLPNSFLRIRIPNRRHRELALLAHEFGLSLNELTIIMLSGAVSKALERQRGGGGGREFVCGAPIKRRLASPRNNEFDCERVYSGEWSQRMPKLLINEISSLAFKDKISINLEINNLLAEELTLFRKDRHDIEVVAKRESEMQSV